MKSRKFNTILFIFLFSVSSLLSETTDENAYFNVSLAQDPSFGFYPIASGGIEVASNLDLTFYGIFWTQNALGNANGENLYTEFGMGLKFKLINGALSVNPNFGIVSGNYHSGSGRPLLGEGIVPSIYIGYALGDISLNGALIYWKGIREEGLADENAKYRDLLQYMITPTYTISSLIDLGLYYDHVILTERDSQKSYSNTLYTWLGPSITFKSSRGASLMFAFGLDIGGKIDNPVDGNNDLKDFYKLVLSIDI